ncbi:hypothetical protein F5Y06DRAFT_273748 [Hypoxylon sp. FL0890]|nr:hypothetical protein F5Y06DRAFT_273748 [Hypoxylon sp. FL0890]
MQQTKLPRLSTPTQGQPHRPSNPYRPQPNGYSQNLQPLPAAYGYLPQETRSQDYRRLVSEGSHAVPLRMQRVSMNGTETRAMPIPSLQLSTDRPYSVPTYLDYRTRSENSRSFARPPRPASSSDVDSIHRLAPSHPVLFPQQRTVQKAENDSLTLHSITAVDAVRPINTPKVPRAVAKRGPTTSSNDSSRAGLNLTLLPPEQNSTEVIRAQKRATDLTAMKYFPSKRININLTLTQSQTPVNPEVYSLMNPHIRDTQVKKDNYIKDNTTKNETSENLEEADDNTTQGYDSENEATEVMLTSERSGQTGSVNADRPDQDDVTSKAGPVEGLQKARDPDKAAGIASALNNTPRNPNAIPEILDEKGQNHAMMRHRYTNAWNQCDIDLEAVPSATRVEPEATAPENHHQPTSVIRGITSARDAAEREVNNVTLTSRLSKVEEVISVQKEKGMDEFVKARLNSGDPNVLETLTNEILLGMVVHDDELLEQVLKIMQVP